MGLLQRFTSFLIKNLSGGTIKNEIISNKELAEELRTPVIIKCEKEKKSTLAFYRQ